MYRLRQQVHRSFYPGSRTWIGRVAPDSLDELILTIADEGVAGSLTLGAGSWSLTGRLDALTVAPASAADEGDDTEEEPEPPLGPAEFMGGSFASDGGPYAGGGLPVVDILIVYSDAAVLAVGGNEAGLRAALIGDVALLSNALSTSGVNGQVRLVGLHKIDWDPTVVNPGSGDLARNATLDALIAWDGEGDEALALREATGADIVIGVVKNLHGAGGFANIHANPGPSTAFEGVALRVASLTAQRTIAHEVGHLTSIRHWRDEWGEELNDWVCEHAAAPQHRYAYAWPTAADDPPAPLCNGFGIRTINAGPIPLQTVGGVTVLPEGFQSIHRFANPNLPLAWTCPANGLPYTVPTGSTFQNPAVGGCSAQEAIRLTETWPALEAYRPMKATVDGAVMTSPPAGSALTTSATFQWTGGVSPTNTYWLEVYRPSDGTVYFDNIVVSSSGTVSQFVGDLGNNSDVIAARLWTYMGAVAGGPPQWAFKDYRYRSANKLVSCSAEDPGVVPDSAYVNAACSGCSWSSSLGRVSCSVSTSPVLYTGVGRAVSGFTHGDAYDLAVWGRRVNGGDFCCLMHDPSNLVQSVWLTGSGVSDDLAFLSPETGHQLAPWGQTALLGRIAAAGGADTLSGSNSTSAAYTEELRGEAGNDTIYGNGGNDQIYAGSGDDFAYGGDGNDVIRTDGGLDVVHGSNGNDTLIAAGTARATLHGGAGSDTLCANFLGVKMIGSAPWSGGWNTMYWSSTSGGTSIDRGVGMMSSQANGSFTWCGHTSFSAYLSGWCPNPSLSTVPTLCGSNGIGQ